MKHIMCAMLAFMTAIVIVSCGASDKSSSAPASESSSPAATKSSVNASIPDGVYDADFNTDSNMFHVNEANNGKGTLTVKDGKMTIHVSLVSKSIVNLYPGSAEDAKKDDAVLIEPTTNTEIGRAHV